MLSSWCWPQDDLIPPKKPKGFRSSVCPPPLKLGAILLTRTRWSLRFQPGGMISNSLIHYSASGIELAFYGRSHSGQSRYTSNFRERERARPPRQHVREPAHLSLMLQEIAEQPAALRKTIAEERAKVARLGTSLKQRDIDLIVLVARGSSDNAALFGRYLLEITTGIPVSLSAPSVHTIYGAKLKLDHALVVGVSQSGEGEDINRVLKNARASGAYTVGITNEPNSSMSSLVDETLLMHGGRERSVAATKTFSGQMLLFYMLAEELATAKPSYSYELIPGFVERALEQKPAILDLVQRYVFMQICLVVGRGLAYATAHE